jgi:hypothetical protein
LIWFAICAAIISLISKNYWPRFYLVLLPPLLFGGAYAIYRFALMLADTWKTGRPGWKRGVTAMLVAAVVVLTLVVIPVYIKMDKIVRFEYVPGGNYVSVGTDEVISYLKHRDRGGKTVVFTASRDRGFLSRCLDIYLQGNSDFALKDLRHPVAPGPIPPPRSAGISEVLGVNRAAIERALKGGPVYILVDSARLDAGSAGWPMEVLKKFDYPDVKELDVATVNPQPSERCSILFVRLKP